MSDLEIAISAWRQKMLAAGIQTPVPLDELEAHLRDEIADLVKSGANEPEAFAIAVRRIGKAIELKNEFLKTQNATKGVNMIRTVATLVGLFGMAFGLGLILPALAHHNHHPEAWTGQEIYPLTLGAGVLLLGACAAFYCIRTRRETRGRIVIAFALLLVSVPFFGTAIITLLSHTGELTPAGWVVFLIAVAASAAYFGNCFLSNWRQPRRAAN